jgi:histidine ammonia-lyase
VATLGEDRYLAPDLDRAASLVSSGTIAVTTNTKFPELI